jgi:predicted branched-subunit amino acid permease
VQVYWVGSVTLGALAGALVPAGVVGLDFAVTALFVVLGIDAFRARRDVPAAVVAVACALAGTALSGEGSLPAGLGLLTAYLLVRYAAGRSRA